jgi:LmbE family N-acetylglucosaminyl deacetylase
MNRPGLGLCLSIAIVATPAAGAARKTSTRDPSVLTFGRERALVVSPHPDDATLGAAGLIQRVISRGGLVRVVQLTGGDGFSTGVMAIRPGVPPSPVEYRWYGSVREREAIRAMRRLGVSRAQVRLLGFPDDGLCSLTSAYRTGAAFESPYTRRASPPNSEQIIRGTMYRGDDLIRELTEVVEQFKPTLVVLPHSGDQHPDHCATHLLVHQAVDGAVARGVRPPRLLHYLVHYPEWPARDAGAAPPGGALASGWIWKSLRLTAGEQAMKRSALGSFHSQTLVMPEFLNSFVRSDEFFVEGEPTQPIPCWCSGENITSASATRAVH